MYMYTVSWIQNRTEIMLDNKKLGEKPHFNMKFLDTISSCIGKKLKKQVEEYMLTLLFS